MGPNAWGFQFLLILDLLGIGFHAVVVFGLGKNLLFKYMLGRCGQAEAGYGLRWDKQSRVEGKPICVCQPTAVV